MFWRRGNRGKPFKATRKYLATIKYCLKYFQSVLKSRALAVHALIGAYHSLFHKKIKLRDPSCDVSCKSRNVQDGGQLNVSSQNVSRNKADKNSVIDICILFLSLFQIFVDENFCCYLFDHFFTSCCFHSL